MRPGGRRAGRVQDDRAAEKAVFGETGDRERREAE